MIHIDGGFQEGGGQILRTALALSALTGLPFQATSIRKNRPVPGLKAQHRSAVQALVRMSGARAEGVRVGAADISFFPGRMTAGDYDLDIGTAGSVTLLLQALLLPCLFAGGPVNLTLRGGTDTRWSVPADHFTHLILPAFSAVGAVSVTGLKRGYYPKGQGMLSLKIGSRQTPAATGDGAFLLSWVRGRIPPLERTFRPPVDRIQGVSAAASVLKNARVAERQADAAIHALGANRPVDIGREYGASASPGTVITLWAQDRDQRAWVGADALGERGKPAEAVGREAAGKLLDALATEAPTDVHLADNLVPLLALCGGKIRTPAVTDHIRANMYVCEAFLGVRFYVDEAAGVIGVAR